ncbi:MAG: ABC transporter ATP-binding protein [Erysipelotrichaceae bacterium]|nr:ABC transporter ATP-binding protein [Erysipelotrichaceae bacterium]
MRNYKKCYGDKVAVDGINLTVEPGEIFGFIGHNGAGKTTTIKGIVGIMDFDAGEILINGHSIVTDAITCKKMMAYIPDNSEFYEVLTGIKYINFISDIFEVAQDKRQPLIQKYADIFEMTSNLGDSISSYSRGMKQKLAIIAALVHQPQLLVLDEPFVGLDPKATHSLKLIMREICDKGGSIFFSTHVLEVAEKLCDHIAVIKEGKIIAVGTIEEILGKKSLEEVFLELTDHD